MQCSSNAQSVTPTDCPITMTIIKAITIIKNVQKQYPLRKTCKANYTNILLANGASNKCVSLHKTPDN